MEKVFFYYFLGQKGQNTLISLIFFFNYIYVEVKEVRNFTN